MINAIRTGAARAGRGRGKRMNILLVRHTRTALGEGVCYGRSDVALAEDWRGEWARTLAKIPEAARRHASLFASPLSRCRLLAQRFDRPHATDPRLRELDFGDWEMRRWAEIPREQIDAWIRDPGAPVPGGERLGDLYARAAAFIDERSAGRGRDTLAVTHAGFIRCALAHALGLPVEGAFRLGVEYGSVSAIGGGPGDLRVHYVNR